MFKYVKYNQKSGLCTQVAEGSDTQYFKDKGFERKDVEQSEVDGQWYLISKCPHYTEEEIAEKEELSQLTQESQELENTFKELQSMFTQAQMISDTETMEEISNTTKELLGLVEEPTEEVEPSTESIEKPVAESTEEENTNGTEE